MPMPFQELIQELTYQDSNFYYKAVDGTRQKLPVRDYKKYSCKLVQAGTAAPTATVLGDNTLSAAIVWTRTGVGVYNGLLTGAFTASKTAFKYSGYTADGKFIKVTRVDANNVSVVQLDTTFAAVDVIAVPFDLEILVFN